MAKRLPTRAPRVLISLLAVAAMLSAALTVPAGSAQAEGDSEEPRPQLILSVSEARPGETITVEASGFRVGGETFIYTATITIGGVPIASVASVDPASGLVHPGRTNESGLYIAEHLHIDPAETTPDGAFTAEFVLPDDLPAGDHELVVTSCWAGPDEDYPEDGVAPCGTVGLGGGVNDRTGTATLTIVTDSVDEPAEPMDEAEEPIAEADEPMDEEAAADEEAAPEPADTGNAGLGIEQDSGVPAGVIALIVAIAALGAGIAGYRLSRRRA